MSLRQTRRALLRATGLAVGAGLAGCGTTDDGAGNGNDPSPSGGSAMDARTTYGITVENRFTVEEFEDTEALSGPEPSTVHVRVRQLTTGEDPYFEETVVLETGDSETFPEAFAVEPEGPTYAVSVELEPFVSGGLSDSRNRRDSLTFTPDERPAANPLRVVVQSLNPPDTEGLFPVASIRSEPEDE